MAPVERIAAPVSRASIVILGRAGGVLVVVGR
jgi:hypothetical protein